MATTGTAVASGVAPAPFSFPHDVPVVEEPSAVMSETVKVPDVAKTVKHQGGAAPTLSDDLAINDDPFSQRDFLERLEKERKYNESNWETILTGIQVPPFLMMEFELLKENNPLKVLQEWKQCESLSSIKETLEDIKSILEQEEENTPEQQHLLDQVQERFGSHQVLLDLYGRLFNYHLSIEQHKDFGTNVMFRANLEFLPESFLYNPQDSQHIFTRYYKACQEGDPKMAPTMASCRMRYCNPVSEYDPFVFHGNPSHTDSLKTLFCLLLQEYAGMSGFSEFEWAISFLYTVLEGQQDPHVDYRHDTMKDLHQRKRKRKRGEEQSTLPWSLDMPLHKGGLRLAFYGPEDNLKTIPEVVHVPFGKALFWRGDCVHAGCLADMQGGHGFRMHAYLPLEREQRHMMLTVKPEIEWFDAHGQRYTQQVKRYDGTSFLDGNERFETG